jgi:CubicO group peptidase (beta-lactamase class C family)
VLSGGSLLSPRLHAAQMRWTRIRVDGDPGWRHGLGLFMWAGGWRGHTGYIPGYSTAMAHDPSSGATVVVTGAGPMGAVARTAMFKVMRIIDGPAGRG